MEIIFCEHSVYLYFSIYVVLANNVFIVDIGLSSINVSVLVCTHVFFKLVKGHDNDHDTLFDSLNRLPILK